MNRQTDKQMNKRTDEWTFVIVESLLRLKMSPENPFFPPVTHLRIGIIEIALKKCFF